LLRSTDGGRGDIGTDNPIFESEVSTSHLGIKIMVFKRRVGGSFVENNVYISGAGKQINNMPPSSTPPTCTPILEDTSNITTHLFIILGPLLETGKLAFG
jgi:hypothetical protein